MVVLKKEEKKIQKVYATKKIKNVKTTTKMIVTTKSKSKTKTKKSSISQLPECTIMSQFPMSDNNIVGFKRFINSPMDCVINALQLFGLLDTVSANLLRIPASLQDTGFSKEEIEMIFILFMGNNFTFTLTKNFQEFATYIETFLNPGYAIFAGYTGHVFILARHLNGEIMLIDPQEPIYCNINNCQDKIRTGSNYFLLFNSVEKLSKSQLQKLGFSL